MNNIVNRALVAEKRVYTHPSTSVQTAIGMAQVICTSVNSNLTGIHGGDRSDDAANAY